MLAAMNYGRRLDEALKRAGKTRKELAEHLGISVQGVGKVINGMSNALTADNSARAARFLRVDHHWLATGQGDAKPAMSPLAGDLARMFDEVPVSERDRLYAVLSYTIEHAMPVQQPTAPADAAPKPLPRSGR